MITEQNQLPKERRGGARKGAGRKSKGKTIKRPVRLPVTLNTKVEKKRKKIPFNTFVVQAITEKLNR